MPRDAASDLMSPTLRLLSSWASTSVTTAEAPHSFNWSKSSPTSLSRFPGHGATAILAPSSGTFTTPKFIRPEFQPYIAPATLLVALTAVLRGFMLPSVLVKELRLFLNGSCRDEVSAQIPSPSPAQAPVKALVFETRGFRLDCCIGFPPSCSSFLPPTPDRKTNTDTTSAADTRGRIVRFLIGRMCVCIYSEACVCVYI
mmetsp:Transcript_6187/g.11452  ORF Transcript_6187/g.11452 Transcript_6187/m.11452 type:complete len:200 (+) Transcript_6187:32-631(+)